MQTSRILVSQLHTLCVHTLFVLKTDADKSTVHCHCFISKGTRPNFLKLVFKDFPDKCQPYLPHAFRKCLSFETLRSITIRSLTSAPCSSYGTYSTFPLQLVATAIAIVMCSLLSVSRLAERPKVSTSGIERSGTTPVNSSFFPGALLPHKP